MNGVELPESFNVFNQNLDFKTGKMDQRDVIVIDRKTNTLDKVKKGEITLFNRFIAWVFKKGPLAHKEWKLVKVMDFLATESQDFRNLVQENLKKNGLYFKNRDLDLDEALCQHDSADSEYLGSSEQKIKDNIVEFSKKALVKDSDTVKVEDKYKTVITKIFGKNMIAIWSFNSGDWLK